MKSTSCEYRCIYRKTNGQRVRRTFCSSARKERRICQVECRVETGEMKENGGGIVEL